MSIVVDISIISIIILSTFLGYKKGLIGVAFKIISFFLAISLAFVLCKPVSNYIIKKTTLDDTIQTTIEEAFSSKILDENTKEQSNTNIPQIMSDYIQKEITNATSQAQNQIAKVVSQNVTSTIINAVSFIVTFFILKIILLILKVFSEQLANFPIIKQFNKLGGTIYGILRGFFIIYLVLGLLSLLMPFISNNDFLYYITNSFLGNIFYQHNLLLTLLF